MTDIATAPTGAHRRGFLLRAGTATAAVVGVAAAGPSLASTVSPGASEPSTPQPTTADLVGVAQHAAGTVFYVRNAARGEIGILVGERELIITDRELVSRMLAAAGR